MTLDEAIKHAEEVADGHDRIKQIKAVTLEECRCAEDHRQLAEWLKELKDYRERIPSYETGYNDAKREIALSGEYERVYERGKLDAEQAQWVPTSERLPEEDTNVLCWYEYFRYGNYNKMYQTYGVGTYFGRFGWAGDITGEQARVIAWMPLPEPYELQESEEQK